MTDLMAPRYKVMADYPGSSFPVGEILIPNDKGELYSEIAGFSEIETRIMLKDAKKFQHLVRELKWYEDRLPGEMPEYVKCKDACCCDVTHFEKGGIYETSKVISSSKECIRFFLPATLAEYDNYINTKPEQK
jgi:hypothetical protein